MTETPQQPFSFFARGIDGFYLPADAPGRVLVRSGTPEVDWARSFLPAEQVIEFHAPALRDSVYPDTSSLLANSDIGARLKQKGVKHLLLSSSCTTEMRR